MIIFWVIFAETVLKLENIAQLFSSFHPRPSLSSLQQMTGNRFSA